MIAEYPERVNQEIAAFVEKVTSMDNSKKISRKHRDTE